MFKQLKMKTSPVNTAHQTEMGGTRGVMVIVTGYGHGDTSSIRGQDSLHFT